MSGHIFILPYQITTVTFSGNLAHFNLICFVLDLVGKNKSDLSDTIQVNTR